MLVPRPPAPGAALSTAPNRGTLLSASRWCGIQGIPLSDEGRDRGSLQAFEVEARDGAGRAEVVPGRPPIVAGARLDEGFSEVGNGNSGFTSVVSCQVAKPQGGGEVLDGEALAALNQPPEKQRFA